MPFRIERNVGGVRGLHVAYDLISEDMERRLFTHPGLFLPVQALMGHRQRVHDQQITMGCDGAFFPPELFAVINAARDCSLDPDMVTFDYCLSLSYPGKSQFKEHFDSRYKWGECILAVNLGAACTVRFQKRADAGGGEGGAGGAGARAADEEEDDSEDEEEDDEGGSKGPKPKKRKVGLIKVDTLLPRRAAYIMEHDARDVWKHQIHGVINTPVPGWNPGGMRRSLIFRTNRAYNLYALQRQVRLLCAAPGPTDQAAVAKLTARLTALGRYACKGNDYKKFDAEQMALHEARTERVCDWLDRHPHLRDMRLARRDAPFYGSLPPALQALYPERPAYDTATGNGHGHDNGGGGGVFQEQGHRLGGGGANGGGDKAAALVANPLFQAVAAALMHAHAETEDEDLRRALEASAREQQAAGGKGHGDGNGGVEEVDDEDEELRRAIAVSLAEQEAAAGGDGGGSNGKNKAAAAVVDVVDLT